MPENRKNAFHQNRVNEEIARAMTDILRNVKDPRVSSSFVSITRAEATPDLKYAKIYYSVLTGDAAAVKKGLVSATGYIRKELASRLNLRLTPELTFLYDTSIEKGAHISTLLKNL